LTVFPLLVYPWGVEGGKKKRKKKKGGGGRKILSANTRQAEGRGGKRGTP